MAAPLESRPRATRRLQFSFSAFWPVVSSWSRTPTRCVLAHGIATADDCLPRMVHGGHPHMPTFRRHHWACWLREVHGRRLRWENVQGAAFEGIQGSGGESTILVSHVDDDDNSTSHFALAVFGIRGREVKPPIPASREEGRLIA